MASIVAHILGRIQRLRDLADRDDVRGDSLRRMRLKALQLKAQRHLAGLLAPTPQLRPIPIRITSRPPR